MNETEQKCINFIYMKYEQLVDKQLFGYNFSEYNSHKYGSTYLYNM